jgi:hypothetical protein
MDTREATLILGVSLLGWGVWPMLRQLCAAPIAAFATLNIGAQVLAAGTGPGSELRTGGLATA